MLKYLYLKDIEQSSLYCRFYADNSRCQLQSRQVNQRLVLEGVLKVQLNYLALYGIIGMRPDVTDSVMKSALKEITKGKIFIVWLTVPYHVLHFKV